MKTVMKKILIVLVMTAIVASALPLFVNAATSQKELDYEIGNEHYTVIFEDGFSEDQMKFIAKSLLGIEDETAKPYGLMCTLFGHNYEDKGCVDVITHKTRASAPRCLCESYLVTICSRCEDTVYTLMGKSYISCCPVD